jgi:hypothetical protein
VFGYNFFVSLSEDHSGCKLNCELFKSLRTFLSAYRKIFHVVELSENSHCVPEVLEKDFGRFVPFGIKNEDYQRSEIVEQGSGELLI